MYAFFGLYQKNTLEKAFLFLKTLLNTISLKHELSLIHGFFYILYLYLCLHTLVFIVLILFTILIERFKINTIVKRISLSFAFAFLIAYVYIYLSLLLITLVSVAGALLVVYLYVFESEPAGFITNINQNNFFVIYCKDVNMRFMKLIKDSCFFSVLPGTDVSSPDKVIETEAVLSNPNISLQVKNTNLGLTVLATTHPHSLEEKVRIGAHLTGILPDFSVQKRSW